MGRERSEAPCMVDCEVCRNFLKRSGVGSFAHHQHPRHRSIELYNLDHDCQAYPETPPLHTVRRPVERLMQGLNRQSIIAMQEQRG